MSGFFGDNTHAILAGLGILFSGTAVATGIVAARKAAEAKAQAQVDSSVARQKYEDEVISKDEYDKSEKEIKTKQVLTTAMYYAVPVACEVVSIACIIGGQKQLVDKNNVLLDQNSQLMGNLAAVAGSLSKQQKVFKEALGEAEYREIANNIKTEAIETVNDKGKPKKSTVKLIADKDSIEDSAFIFGPYKANGEPNPRWSANMDDNYAYVDSMGEFFNNLLERKPIVFRNQVVEYFDDSIEAQTEAGQYFGKCASLRNPSDTYIRLSATDYMIRDPKGELVDCLLVQTNLNDSVAQYLR